LGGLSGIVGPRKIGFGAFTVAGQIISEQVADGRIFSSIGRAFDKSFNRFKSHLSPAKIELNLASIGQLLALKAWYSQVKLAMISESTDELEKAW
jgi:hypothetical protein